MEEFQFTLALSYDFGALANMFTEAFTGYFFPMTMAPDALANHWRLYHIDGARSLVMRDSRAFTGIALIGARGAVRRVGIAPAFRGRGAGKRLAREMIRRRAYLVSAACGSSCRGTSAQASMRGWLTVRRRANGGDWAHRAA
jgi:ribosomal protein S18 acetylase RimI-like enzyme